MTDGKPTIGETDEDRLLERIRQANTAGVRIFTFGIGNDINTHLLDRLTEATRASRAYIAPTEDIEVKVSAFYSKVRSPVLTDVRLDFGAGMEVFQLYPRELPDLFQGSSLTVFGRYRGEGAVRVTLRGKVGGHGTPVRVRRPAARARGRADTISSRRCGPPAASATCWTRSASTARTRSWWTRWPGWPGSTASSRPTPAT